MDIKELLELTHAGFSKDEILALVSTKTEPATAPIVEPTPAPKAEEVKVDKVEPATPAQTAITLTDEQLKTLAQTFAVQTTGGTIELPKSSDEVLSEHFLSILKGE